jgi:hypothetical protein
MDMIKMGIIKSEKSAAHLEHSIALATSALDLSEK